MHASTFPCSDLYVIIWCYLFLFEVREKEEDDTFVGDGGMDWRRLRRPEAEGVVMLACSGNHVSCFCGLVMNAF